MIRSSVIPSTTAITKASSGPDPYYLPPSGGHRRRRRPRSRAPRTPAGALRARARTASARPGRLPGPPRRRARGQRDDPAPLWFALGRRAAVPRAAAAGGWAQLRGQRRPTLPESGRRGQTLKLLRGRRRRAAGSATATADAVSGRGLAGSPAILVLLEEKVRAGGVGFASLCVKVDGH